MMAVFSPQWAPALVALFLPILISVLKSKKKLPKGAKFPPSPPKLPVIGHLHKLGTLPHQSLWHLAQKYGPIMQLQLGSIPTVVVSSAEMAEQVMKTHDLECCSRPPSPGPKKLSYNFLDVAFAPYTDYWREMRKLFIFELLSMKRVQQMWYAREAEIDRLIKSLTDASPNQPVDLNEKIFALSDGITGTVAFGKSYGAKQFKDQKFQDVLDVAMNMLSSFSAEDFFPSVGPFIDFLTGRRARLEKLFRELNGYFQKVLDFHLDPNRPKPEEEDLVDVLVGLSKAENATSFRLTNEHIKSLLLDTFVGSIDTSALTMLWTMSELFMNPRVMKKVQAEVRSKVGRKLRLEKEDVQQLKYLKMVVRESLRMHPPAPFLISRQTMQHCKLGGYDIFPETKIIVNAWAIGRNPKSWENPDVFYPERFENNDIDFKGQHFQLVPFGAGRRICPGMLMGITSVEFTLANLLYGFDWELPPGMKREDISMEEEGGLTCHKKNHLVLVPVKHKWED